LVTFFPFDRSELCPWILDSWGVSYAPPVSGAELRSARVGVTLGRPVNAAAGVFFFHAIFSFSFFWFLWLFLVFCFLFFFSFFFS
jgi:hypothetical protein